ncbi:malto-oligosyltrehalose trehalohydrolase [Candidatus Methylospira mobilis]|uniref:Malto-oligosyltrehalose trehalohydrolase n=2 Tax=Candidatus Methylospira mobilis TaxID=1808979 RepID=A0A5Q0BSF5_9GAMM|nr:malto-oligosyltrehalose trehalohydrolase [Candidatus Methylospira mobilis]QFY45114.1 malto-oligosyltrehalose trehalohydrolase [Candidatus Methylospira mobilis]WNV03939.1 malto-oligosyltrehalose trehalohydrolase [Candidatus Methylospira mobilis]
MPFGATVLADGKVIFRLWAPTARTVELCLGNQAAEESVLTMDRLADGWFQCETPPALAGHGTLYRYRIDGGLCVPDPASRANPLDAHGPSQVIDAGAFVWKDDDWHGRPWHEAVIYELHLGAFTAEGGYTAAIQRLDYLAELGVTAVELMPVADFPGARNWGYDGVLQFAPDHSYGTPDELKALVQAAHARGLMVLLDVVYNHFGPDGNYLHTYAPQFFTERHHTPWGAAINFDGRDSRTVRDFYIHNALYWLDEYHLDGLRLDAVHAIADDSRPDILEELAAAVHDGPGRSRQAHLILENDANAVRYLRQGQFTAQWNDDIHHALHLLLTGECDGYYADYADQPARHLARCLAEGFAFQGESSGFREGRPRGEPSGHLPPGAFVNFIQTHDQVGNRAYGERITMIALQRPLQVVLSVLLLAPSPPMLFMGEEFAAATPFLFFCDFHGELAEAIAEGRRMEFARFRAFANPAARAHIPDPNAPATFERSKLDWGCLDEPQHKFWLDHYRSMLTLRREQIAPRLPGICAGGEFELAGASGLIVRWGLRDGARMTLLANLGESPVEGFEHFSGIALPSLFGREIQTIYLSQSDLPDFFSAGRMPPWCAAWFIEEKRA